MSYRFSKSNLLLLTAILLSVFIVGCNAEAARTTQNSGDKTTANTNSQPAPGDERSSGSKIKIEENSPADTVRVFYKNLREKKFREAMYLTNLRPAMEGLTDSELKEFQVDFSDVAEKVPANVEINGEIISGETAIVTANLPGEDLEKNEVQQIKLRRENGVWIILMVDEKAEAMIKKEGKNYFYALRIDTHEIEAEKLLQKVADVQRVMLAQNGKFADVETMISKNLLPADIRSSESTGYNFAVNLSSDGKSYVATATPAVYGKTGKLSFVVDGDGKKIPKVISKDTGGLALKK